MTFITRSLLALTLIAGACIQPVSASAAIDVTRDATTGALNAASTADAIETVTIARTGAGLLRISDASAPVTSSDASCAAAAGDITAVDCTAPTGTVVSTHLGAGNDLLDARAATGIALTADGGAGIDTFRLGSSGMATVSDTTTTDVIDLSGADGDLRVRYESTPHRLVARCGGCSTPWAVTLPAAPGRVVLGAQRDDVELAAWRTYGLTTWMLGAGADRFFGAPFHRSIADGSDGADTLVSRTAADVLRGGRGTDKIADFGGTGDVLSGGADIDMMASLDGKRDTMDGGAGRDQCLSLRRPTSTCDTSGRVRSFEMSTYVPLPSQRTVFMVIGIR